MAVLAVIYWAEEEEQFRPVEYTVKGTVSRDGFGF
jgi:hypothetical protein